MIKDSSWSKHLIIQIQFENDSKISVHRPFSIHVHVGWNGVLQIADLQCFSEGLLLQSLEFDVHASNSLRFGGSCPFLRLSVKLRYLRFLSI